MRIRDIPVGQRLNLLFGFLLLMMLIGGSLSWWVNHKVEVQTEQIVEQNLPLLSSTSQLAEALDEAVADLILSLMVSDPGLQEDIERSLSQAEQTLQQIQWPEGLAEHGESLRQKLEALRGLAEQVRPLLSQPTLNMPGMAIANQEAAPLAREISGQLQILADVDEMRALRAGDDWRRALTDLRAYLFNRNEQVWGDFQAGLDNFAKKIDAWSKKKDLDFEEEDALAVISEKLSAYRESTARIHQAHSSEQWRQDLYLSRHDIMPLFKAMSQELNELNRQIRKQVDENGQAAVENLAFASNLLLLAVVVVSAVLVLIILLSRLTILHPLWQLLRAMQAAADEGNLSTRLDDSSKDEFGALGRAFNIFSSNIRTLVSQVVGSTRNLVDASARLKQVTHETEVMADDGQQRVEQISGTIDQLAQGMMQIGRLADDATQAADQVSSEVKEGGAVIAQTIQGIQTISSQSSQVAEEVEALSESSRRIAEIVQVIRQINEQTNMLALNAAIEAARAGEAGRGFAVVADEVRGLAIRVQEQADEIQQRIDQLCRQVDDAVQVIQSSHTEARRTSQRATEAEQALQTIQSGIGQILGSNRKVLDVSTDHADNARQVADELGGFVELVQQMAEQARQAGVAGDEFSRLAEELGQQVGQFMD